MLFAAFLTLQASPQLLEAISSKKLFPLPPILASKFLHLTILISKSKPLEKTLSQHLQNTLPPFPCFQPLPKTFKVTNAIQPLIRYLWKNNFQTISFLLLRKPLIKNLRKL
jgi:hypothetical protein